ncbi:MerR family transcriptional regulator [Kamptonema cortianum]|nr:MerR family transcriptional regulator [Geitlerinema splendidum]MDK3157087.1 MerR family transcriptional regulator [Kamptonema cortianum]
MSLTYSISAVAEATGLSVHTIRAWEKRYGVPKTHRTDTNRRVYDASAVRHLRLLHEATNAGHSIGMISELNEEELTKLLQNSGKPTLRNGSLDHLQFSLAAMRDLDSEALELSLSRAAILLGIEGFLDHVVVPLIAELDRGWNEGYVTISQEHLVSAALRTQLEKLRQSISVPANAPRILVTTIAGQYHELGALLVCIAAARSDWNVTYLGPNLPAPEIASATQRTRSSVIGLSMVYPEADERAMQELRQLRSLVGNEVTILLGGRAADSYREVANEINARIVSNGAEFPLLLARLY